MNALVEKTRSISLDDSFSADDSSVISDKSVFGDYIEITDSQVQDMLGDRYQVCQKIGQGAMGVVYQALDTKINREVAIKILIRNSEHVLQRFLKEVEALGCVNHPNVVQIYDYGEGYGLHYYIMEYLEGWSLDECIVNNKPIADIDWLLDMIIQTAQALNYCHIKGVIHRDIKPSNIFIVRREDGSVFPKLIDFGMVKLIDSINSNISKDGYVVGTPLYMSVEQILKPRSVNNRTDIYGLGMTLYVALSGMRPFAGVGTGEIIQNVLDMIPEKLYKLNNDVSWQLSQACVRAMEKNPNKRFFSADEFAAKLQECRRKKFSFIKFFQQVKFARFACVVLLIALIAVSFF